jgi:hypothetical protein
VRFANGVGLERLASLLHSRLLPTAGFAPFSSAHSLHFQTRDFTTGTFFRVLHNATVTGSNYASSSSGSSTLNGDVLRAFDHGIRADGFVVGSSRWRESCCLILFSLSYASSVIPVHASVLYLACPCLRAMATATPLTELAPWKFVLSCHVTDAAARTYFSLLYACYFEVL